MAYVMRAVGPPCVEGQYLEWFDLDDHAPNQPYPAGYVHFTSTLERALRFDTAKDALDTWKTQSTLSPLRPDGLPNRPLTAFSMEILSVKGD